MNEQQILQEIIRHAEGGDTEAMLILAQLYLDGEGGVPKDDATGCKWLAKAATMGNAKAQYNLSICYRDGVGVPADSSQAMYWLTLAARQGYADALYNMGAMYEEGQLCAKDFYQAVQWYALAVKSGDVEAAYRIGRCYSAENWPGHNDALAVQWYQYAADRNHKKALNRLIISYSEGKGVPVDYLRTMQLMEKLAEAGDPSAQLNMAEAYEKGLYVEKNAVKAFGWYAIAAANGELQAMKHMAREYYQGINVPCDLIQSLMYMRMAADVGDEEAAQILAMGRPFPLPHEEDTGYVIPKGSQSYRFAVAFYEWAKDIKAFDTGRPRVGLNMKEDLARLFTSLTPLSSGVTPLFRALYFSDAKAFRKVEKQIDESGFYAPLRYRVADPFTFDRSIAEKYAAMGSWSILLCCDKYTHAVDLRLLCRALLVDSEVCSLAGDELTVILGNSRLLVLSKEKRESEAGASIIYHLQESEARF